MTTSPLQQALARAPERTTEALSRPEVELFCFSAGELALAFPAAHVREVVRLSAVTPLPRAPQFLRGVCGHRGEVLPVFDLLRYLGHGETRSLQRARLVVGVFERFVAGFLAEDVAGLRTVERAALQQAPVGADRAAEHLESVFRQADGSSLHVLDLPRLLQTLHARVVRR